MNFIPLSFTTGKIYDLTDDVFPTNLYAFDGEKISLKKENTSYTGFVFSDEITLNCSSGSFTISEGMYFSCADFIKLSGNGKAIIIEQFEHNAFFQLGGPIEKTGRLKYIDGCTDSLLICPIIMGNPCLNLLQIPQHTFQSQHTHPSFRIGIIVKGHGTCVTPKGDFTLTPGQIFVIPTNAYHSFTTKNEDLVVVAYHPDSDFGPTHENHPMINKTLNLISTN